MLLIWMVYRVGVEVKEALSPIEEGRPAAFPSYNFLTLSALLLFLLQRPRLDKKDNIHI